MANKKFSQFTLAADVSAIDFVVGYKDVDNIQIEPAKLDSLYGLNSLPIVGGGSNVILEGLAGPDLGTSYQINLLEGTNIEITDDGANNITITNTQLNTFIVNGTFKNLFGGNPGIFGDTLEFGQASVPSTDNSSVFIAPFDCEIVSVALKYISDDAVVINAGSSWQVKIFTMSSPLGSTTDSSNYDAGVDIPGLLLDNNDNGTYPLKTATGFSGPPFALNAGDVINISGVETGSIAQSDAEMEVYIGIRAK